VIKIDPYVTETLMRDLAGHDRSPAAFLVYLFLYSRTVAARAKSLRISHQGIADETGLSKSAVQAALRLLSKRRLVRSQRETVTATPEHSVLRPWIRR
jgi:CRP-like cAMP-binding protein